MNILLITCSFYPQNKVSVLRVGQWAKYWALNGHTVTVLTTLKYNFNGPMGLTGNIPSSVRIIEIPFLPNWLENIQNRQDQSDRNISSDNNNHGSRIVTFLKKVIRKMRGSVGSLFDIHDLWVKPASCIGKSLLSNEEFDVIISSYSPPAAHKVAHNLKIFAPKVVWIADFRDLWFNNHILSAKGVFRLIEKAIERRTMKGICNAMITVSKPLTKDLQHRYPAIPVFTLENGFDPEEFPKWRDLIASEVDFGSKLKFCYAGTIYHQKRDPTPLFMAVNELIDDGEISAAQIEISFYGDNRSELSRLISASNANKHDVIRINGFVSRDESLAAQRNSDILLFLEWGDPQAAGVLTGKLFEYIVSGKPVIAIGIDTNNSAGELLQRTGVGICARQIHEIKIIIRQLFKFKHAEFYEPKIDEIGNYARDAQARRLIDLVTNLQEN
ncbi:MAG: hypothetical protein PHS32_14155 [Rhodoferax sp.]|uniref:hypothetical protein n=1 Tax=Rhodoferax sp. TaxID=50421 RepID=UPI0026032C18|nr:hypothetical protein [Rhodoferax sp.]MDD5334873.1 hypothetical protein [Rhodoferax sp.]